MWRTLNFMQATSTPFLHHATKWAVELETAYLTSKIFHFPICKWDYASENNLCSRYMNVLYEKGKLHYLPTYLSHLKSLEKEEKIFF